MIKSTKGMVEKGIRRGAKVSPRRRVQKMVIVRLTINHTPLNQSDSSNFAPLTITIDNQFYRLITSGIDEKVKCYATHLNSEELNNTTK